MTHRRRWCAGIALALASALTITLAPQPASAEDPPVEQLVRIRVDSTDLLRELEQGGLDITHDVGQGPGTTFEATVVTDPAGLERLRTEDGVEVLGTLDGPTREEARAQLKGNAEPLTGRQKDALKPAPSRANKPGRGRPPVVSPDGTLTVLRADTWTTGGQRMVSLEVRSEAGRDDRLSVTTDTGQSLTMSAFVDQGTYLYHRQSQPVPLTGDAGSVTVRSGADGSEVTAPLDSWLSSGVTDFPDGFRWGFTDDGYVDSEQTDALIEKLAADNPDVAEVVELPNETVGYGAPGGALAAPASYPREGKTVKALRIGRVRDGSKTGVLLYAQEHAREWVTSLVALETAQRLLANDGTDPLTTSMIDNLDIFIVPQVNPDGVAYALYDDLYQRSNRNPAYCPGAGTNLGVDLNRNFRVGSVHEGFVGASARCPSSTYAGPEPLSESESKNTAWLVEQHPNIKFAMNTHSFGGYFMWSPGAYDAQRNPLPRPCLATEQYFFASSETILSRVREYRDTVVWPGRTGPISDVLYSAAGNSGDDLFYGGDAEDNTPHVYAWNFEVGLPRWDAASQRWVDTGAFWPEFADEGFGQAMEFANGWYGILEVAQAYANDTTDPTSKANVDGRGSYSGPVDVLWETSEPATIYYTTDGSRPTWDSPTVQQDGIRGGALPIRLTKDRTVLQWFAVDQKGNVEGNYDPDRGRGAPQREVIKIR